jgi:hypothetical protein
MAGKSSPKKAIAKKGGDKKDKPKRGISSYIMFVKENRERVIKEYNLDPKQVAPVGAKLGELWKKLSQTEKDSYKAKAEAHNAKNKA